MYINIHTVHMFTDERLLSYVISNKESTSSGFGSKVLFPGMASSMKALLSITYTIVLSWYLIIIIHINIITFLLITETSKSSIIQLCILVLYLKRSLSKQGLISRDFWLNSKLTGKQLAMILYLKTVWLRFVHIKRSNYRMGHILI